MSVFAKLILNYNKVLKFKYPSHMAIQNATQRLHFVTKIRKHLVTLCFPAYRWSTHIIVILLLIITVITLFVFLDKAAQIHVANNSLFPVLGICMDILSIQVVH